MSIKPVQNQFNGGEISPLMDARFDLPAYQYSASIMQNFIPISEGCFKRRGGTHFVASVKQSDAVLFKIVPTPSDALVVINGVEQQQCYVAVGDVVSYSVSASTYQPQNGTYIVNNNTTHNVALVSAAERCTFTISATPSDAIVIINDMQRTSQTLALNSSVSWAVMKSGYRTQSGGVQAIKKDTSISVALKMRFAITPIPSDAVVTINGQKTNYIDVDPNTSVTWSVAKAGYQTKGATEIVKETINKTVSLSKQAVGQVMFDSSTAGTYSLELEAGEYDLLMCGAGGKGWRRGSLKPQYGTGGSGAVFQGIIKLTADTYSLKVGSANGGTGAGDTLFADIITAGGGANATWEGNYSGGVLAINSVSEIVSTIITSDGNTAKAAQKNFAPLPDAYKNLYGYGGGYNSSYHNAGSGYIRLVYRG